MPELTTSPVSDAEAAFQSQSAGGNATSELSSTIN